MEAMQSRKQEKEPGMRIPRQFNPGSHELEPTSDLTGQE
jgi:hypothetical protein